MISLVAELVGHSARGACACGARVATLAAPIVLLAILGPPGASAAPGCALTKAHGGPAGQLVSVRVTILAGAVSCTTATRVITDSIDSHAAFKGHGSGAYRNLDGWTCYRPALGYAGCLNGKRAILGRYSPARCAAGYDLSLPQSAGGAKYHDALNLLAVNGLSCSQASGLGHRYDVPHYARKSPPHEIKTSLGTFQCRTDTSHVNSLEGSCTLGQHRIHWYSLLQ